jgi:hypothetical protein
MQVTTVKIWIPLLQLKLCLFIYWLIEQLVWLIQCSGKATGRTTETSDFDPRTHYSVLFYIHTGSGNRRIFYSMSKCVGDVEE